MLSTDPSPWRGEHYFSVSKEVPNADNVTLSGLFLTKVFEGPYRDAGKWVREAQAYVTSDPRTFLTMPVPLMDKVWAAWHLLGFDPQDATRH